MKPVRLTKQAKADLTAIWQTIAAHDERTADRVLDAISDRCQQLQEFPELGPARPDIAESARALLIERWLILYRILPDHAQVVRIVDGARDLSKISLPHEV